MENPNRTEIPGWGVDARPHERPGVPREGEWLPRTAHHDRPPARQNTDVEILRSSTRKSLTPTYGTAIPPSGLSGYVRRFAYTLPDHKAPKWLLLMLADRVNAAEWRVSKVLPLFVLAGALGAMFLRRR